jgi:NADPH-dependent 2,4-dienoyl-CoA reductase/sulfur reductase-like enzyme
MRTFTYVIAGGGMVAGYAAKEMAERGLKAGELCIVSADDSLPYERPPLSKGFLAGKETEESIRISPPDFYESHDIDVRLRTCITGLDAARKVLHLKSDEEIGFDKLVLATGAEVKTLDVPGGELADVCYLRSIDDSRRIRHEAGNAKQATVIGGGFIGMETASVLAQKGIEVTMIIREDRIWKQFFTPTMSEFFEHYYVARGVRFEKEAKIARIEGVAGEVSAVVLEGGRTVDAGLVIAGLGVRPAVSAFESSGLDISDGIAVNEYLETALPGIYAAGDIANYEDTIFGKRRRVEHWDNAVSQGQHCARALMGDRAAFKHVPYFFSDVFDLSYEFWGDPGVADEVVTRGDVHSPSFSVWWLSKDHLVAAFAMNRPDEEREAAPQWIEGGREIDRHRLSKAEKIAEAAK